LDPSLAGDHPAFLFDKSWEVGPTHKCRIDAKLFF
jgi:hypothetical protein